MYSPLYYTIVSHQTILYHVCVSRSVMSDSTIPWTVAFQAPLSMECSRQKYWSGLLLPPPGDLPYPGLNLSLLHCKQILHLSHQGSPNYIICVSKRNTRASWWTKEDKLNELGKWASWRMSWEWKLGIEVSNKLEQRLSCGLLSCWV